LRAGASSRTVVPIQTEVLFSLLTFIEVHFFSDLRLGSAD
jgi:hypothetical protein